MQENLNKSQTKQQNQPLNPEQKQQRLEKVGKLKQGIQKMKKKIQTSLYYRKFLKRSYVQTYKEIQQMKLNYKDAKQEVKESHKQLCHQLQDYQNQQIMVRQQIDQLELDYQKDQLELKQQYLLNRTIQELNDYKILVSSNYNELIVIIYKEDFDQIQEIGQINDPNQQDIVAFLEEKFTNNRKRIIKATILYHYFILKQQNKIQQYNNEKTLMEDKKDKYIKKLNELSQSHEDNLREQNKKEKAMRESNDKRQELELQCTQLKNYIELRKQKYQTFQAKAQLDAQIQKKQQVYQKILSKFDELKTSIEDTGEEIYKNIQDDSQDFKNNITDIDSKINQWKQFMEERSNLKKSQDQIQNIIREDKSDEKIVQLLQVIEKHTPQIKKFSDQDVLKCLGEKNQKIDQIESDNKINQNCLDILKKRNGEILNRQEVLQNHISDIDKEIKSVNLKINTDKQKITLIDVKFKELRSKLEQNPQEQIYDLSKFNADLQHLLNQISEMYTNIIDVEIRQKYSETLQQFQINGANKPENIYKKEYMRNYELKQNNVMDRLQQLKDQENKILQQISKINGQQNGQIIDIQKNAQNTKKLKKLKKSIMGLKKKYRRDQSKLKKRWDRFYKYERQKLDYQKYLKVGKLDQQ